MNKPKPDQRVQDACARLKNYPDFKVLSTYLQAELDYTKHLLVTAPPANVPDLQGRARQLLDFFDLIK